MWRSAAACARRCSSSPGDTTTAPPADAPMRPPTSSMRRRTRSRWLPAACSSRCSAPAPSASTRCTARAWRGWPTRLRVEALAPDGLVEAFSLPDAPAFNLCVQWHPEWQAADNPVSLRLLQAFGRACANAAAGARRRATAEAVPDR